MVPSDCHVDISWPILFNTFIVHDLFILDIIFLFLLVSLLSNTWHSYYPFTLSIFSFSFLLIVLLSYPPSLPIRYVPHLLTSLFASFQLVLFLCSPTNYTSCIFEHLFIIISLCDILRCVVSVYLFASLYIHLSIYLALTLSLQLSPIFLSLSFHPWPFCVSPYLFTLSWIQCIHTLPSTTK